jgi:hypothetical protein
VISSSNSAFGLAPVYISQTPVDPSQPSSGSASAYYYQYETLASDGVTACSSGNCPDYVLVAHFEAAWNNTSWGTTSTTGNFNTLCPTSAPASAPYPYCVHN